MSLGDLGKVCTFSAISGVITLDGQPVTNARVVRTTDFSKKKTDQTTTDDDGHFEMPALFERTITKYLPQEFSVAQEIMVYKDDEPIRIWAAVKRAPEENAESRGEPIVVQCELNSDEVHIKINRQPIFMRCTWNIEPDKEKRIF